MGQVEIKAFGNVYSGKKVLVTGNTGFKGTWLSLWLLELGAEVYGFSNGLPGDTCMYQQIQMEKRIHQIWAEIGRASCRERV